MKDKAILLAWIAGLLLLISILWILTQPLQTTHLLRTINNVLVHNNDSRRLVSLLQQKTQRPGLFGYWYSMYNSTDQMFVFMVFQNGILVPLGAVVTANGIVDEVIPLSSHARHAFGEMPDSILQRYINRIETARPQGREQ